MVKKPRGREIYRKPQEKFLSRKNFPCKSLNLSGSRISKQEVPKTRKTLFLTIFEFIKQFDFQNDIFKLQEVFSELGVRVFLENRLETFQAFNILQI
jgi:hypothetical protein